MKTHKNLAIALALAVSASAAHLTRGDVIATWNGSIGLWDDPTAWSTNPVFPNNAGAILYDVFINAGSVSLKINPTVQNVTLSNASIIGSGSLTVAGLLTLSDNATLGGAGTITTKDLAFNAAGAGITLASGRALVSTGSATWTGAFGISLSNGNNYTNQGTFTINAAADAAVTGGTFVNAGALIKTSVDVTTIASTLNNSGNVSVTAGTLILSSGGTDTGSFSTSGSGLLQFAGGTHNFNAGASIASGNTVTFNGGTENFNTGSTYNVTGNTTISGAAVTFAAASTPASFGSALTLSGGSLTLNSTASASVPRFTLSSGTLQGSSNVSVTSTTNWSGGTIAGSGILTTKDLNFNLAANAILSGTRALVSTGNTTWSGSAGFNITASGTNIYTNQGAFTINTASGSNWTGGTFNNSSSLTKTSADTNAISAIFNNSGTVSVAAGTLSVSNGGTQTGSFSTSPSGTMNFSGGIHNFNGASLSGGNFGFTAGTANFNVNSTYNASTTTVSGASVTFAANATLVSLGNTLSVTGGTLTLNDGTLASVTAFNEGGGTFQGSDSLTVTDTLNWSAGTLAGGGSITTRNLVINQTANAIMSGTRSLTVTANTTWSTTVLANVNISSTNAFTNQGAFVINTAGGNNWTGGTFNNQGSVTKTSSDANSLNTIFNNTGSLVIAAGSLQIGTMPQILVNGNITTLTAGSWEIDDAATLTVTGGPSMNIDINNANVTLSGPTSLFTRMDTLASNNGGFHLLAGRNFSALGAFTNSGTLEIGGGTFSSSQLTNTVTGTLLGFGNMSVRPVNSGTVIASSGTLTLPDGINGSTTSTIQTNANASLDLSAGLSGTTTGTIANNGNLVLGANNLLVSAAYFNANFGAGNAFNKHAHISTTTGQILANGDNKQTLSGNVTSGTSATPSISFGNVHVGDALTRSYQVNNIGVTSGPSVLFAIQTSANGGTLTDSRLSGTGTSASNIGPVAYGSASAPLNLLFTAASDGLLINQSIHVANNFDNIAEQTLSITGAAYNLAAPVISALPLNLGNFHVGDPLASAHFSLANAAPADNFSESLDAATATPTGAIAISGAINLLSAGSSDTTSLTAAVNSTANAGLFTGSAILTLTSDGAGSSNLGLTSLTPVTLTATAKIFRLGAAQIPQNVALPNIHVGDPLPSTAFTLANIAANDGFSEKLDASILTASGAISIGGGVTLLAPGATNNVSLAATLTSAASPGHFTGTATLGLTSDGAGTSNLGLTSLGTLPLSASIDVFRLASVGSIASVSLGNFHVGDPLPASSFTVSNTAVNDGFSESIDASVSAATGPINIAGAFNLLPPGAQNTSGVHATLSSTTAAGHFTGAATLLPLSDGAGTSGLGLTPLSGVSLSAIANVFRFAAPSIATTINLGNFHVGDPLPSINLPLTNAAANDGFSEKLSASATNPIGPIAITGAATLIPPGSTNSTSLFASLGSTAAAGHFTGSANLTSISDGAGTSGLGQTTLSPIALAASANVFRLASVGSVASVNLGNFHVGDPLPSAPFTINNASTNDGFSEKLDANALNASGPIAISGNISLLAPGASSLAGVTAALTSTTTAGHLTGSATLNPISNGAGASNLGLTALAPVSLSASANVFRLAVPSVSSPALTLPNVHVGDPAPGTSFTVSNLAANDGFSESLRASITNASGGVTLSGSSGVIAPGAANTTALTAALVSTTTAGHFTGNANISLLSDGTGTSNLGQTTLATIPVSASANVFRLAAPGTIPTIDLGNIHVGDAATAHLPITNTSLNDGFSEKLSASFITHTGAITATAGSASVTPTATDNTSLVASFDTASAGLNRAGSATVHFASDGTGSSNLGITQLAADQTVFVTANVFNFAQASLQKSSGAGTLTITSPTSATLDLGVLNTGDSLSSVLSVLNAAVGNADTLAGSWTLAAPHFTLAGFTPFSNVAAGAAQSNLQVSFNAGASGVFTDTAILHPLSQNPTFSGNLTDLTLTLQASVNPLTATWNGGVGKWSDGLQWSSHPQVPNNGAPNNAIYAVTITGGTSTLDINPTIGSLSMTGGTLNGSGNLTLSTGSIQGTLNMSGTTTIANGLLTIGGAAQSTGEFAGTGSLLVQAGATVTSDGVLVNGTWTINGSQIIRANGATSGTSKVPSLALAGSSNAWTGKIDLTNNKLIVEAATSAHDSLISQLLNQVHTGRTGAGGIFSSTLSPRFAVAVLDNGILNKLTFGGVPVDPNSILVGPELLGDSNADGHVDLSDLNTVLNHFGATTTAWTSGNFDGAPTVDLTDLSNVLNNFGLTNPAASADVSAVVTSTPTPEPAPAALLALTVPLLVCRRRQMNLSSRPLSS